MMLRFALVKGQHTSLHAPSLPHCQLPSKWRYWSSQLIATQKTTQTKTTIEIPVHGRAVANRVHSTECRQLPNRRWNCAGQQIAVQAPVKLLSAPLENPHQRSTHNSTNAVNSPIAVGIVPLSLLLCRALWDVQNWLVCSRSPARAFNAQTVQCSQLTNVWVYRSCELIAEKISAQGRKWFEIAELTKLSRTTC